MILSNPVMTWPLANSTVPPASGDMRLIFVVLTTFGRLNASLRKSSSSGFSDTYRGPCTTSLKSSARSAADTRPPTIMTFYNTHSQFSKTHKPSELHLSPFRHSRVCIEMTLSARTYQETQLPSRQDLQSLGLWQWRNDQMPPRRHRSVPATSSLGRCFSRCVSSGETRSNKKSSSTFRPFPQTFQDGAAHDTAQRGPGCT